MILPFTLQQLRILKAVASEKSFTKAAEILYVSQPSLSKQIKILENRLGIILLNRENSTISLTEAGRVFLQYSERILALCEESCRALNDVKNGGRRQHKFVCHSCKIFRVNGQIWNKYAKCANVCLCVN